MRGQHVSEAEPVAISPEVAYHQKMAMDASLFWIVHMSPPGMDTHTDQLLLNTLIDLSADQAIDPDSDSYYYPVNNPIIGLLEVIMAFRGALPVKGLELPEQRVATDRLPSVELAELLGLSTRELAKLMRWHEIHPRDIRFPSGVTRGYRFADVMIAWESCFGHFQREAASIVLDKLEKQRGDRGPNYRERRDRLSRYVRGEWGDSDLNGLYGRRVLTVP